MNEYLRNLNKIEFVLTYACTGRCKHCSEGEHTASGETIDAFVAADIVRKVASEYDIKTVTPGTGFVWSSKPLPIPAKIMCPRWASGSGTPRELRGLMKCALMKSSKIKQRKFSEVSL